MDDQPVWFGCRGGKRIMAVPYPQELNDIPAVVGAQGGAGEFADMIVDQFDEMLELSSAAAGHGRRAARIHRGPAASPAAPQAALEHIAARSAMTIWLTTPGAIAAGTAAGPVRAGTFPEGASMRLFTATLATETNTFSPLPTSLENYRESVFLRPGEHPADAPRMCTAPLFVARARAAAEGFTLIEGSCFAASPAGTTNRADYEAMRDEIIDQLKAALPVDGMLFGLHGAMVAHGYDDVEGDISSAPAPSSGRIA